MIDWIMANDTRILIKIAEHFIISLSSLAIGCLIAIPVGIILTRFPKISQVVVSITSIFQTIPSLALLAIMVPIFGVGKLPAIIALVIYSLLPILRNTYLGMDSVNKNVIDASKGMGMTNNQIIFKVQLPLAMPVIMAGVRLSSVYLVAWATLASYIGAGGLGDFIFMGLNNFNFYAILAGAVPVTVIALLFDGALGALERALKPQTSRTRDFNKRKELANAR